MSAEEIARFLALRGAGQSLLDKIRRDNVSMRYFWPINWEMFQIQEVWFVLKELGAMYGNNARISDLTVKKECPIILGYIFQTPFGIPGKFLNFVCILEIPKNYWNLKLHVASRNSWKSFWKAQLHHHMHTRQSPKVYIRPLFIYLLFL